MANKKKISSLAPDQDSGVIVNIHTAYAIGIQQAKEWMDDDHLKVAMGSISAWRATCYADAVHEYESYTDFMELLTSWERAFDKTIGTVPSLTKPLAEHERFSWVSDEMINNPSANFIALAYDVARGIQTCLEIVYESDVTRDTNNDLDEADASLPTVSSFDGERLFRLSIASAGLLTREAERILASSNVHSSVAR